MNDTKIGLVLEGGGMRGVFTSGALDCFMDRNVYFPYIIAVSAGACNGLSFVSRQRGRARFSNIDLLDKYNYIGLKQLLTKRNILDFELLFHTFPSEIIPYDYDTYFNSPGRYVIVTTNCLTGCPEYLEEKRDKDRLYNICRASCSLPVLCPVVEVDGVPMLDGGIYDPIPIRKAIDDGCGKNIIILTRNRGYRKKEKNTSLPWFIYRKYPAIRQQLKIRTRQYNETLAYIEQLEEEGKVFVIRPMKTVTVGRLEKNIEKLTALYNEGYECARQLVDKAILPVCHSESEGITSSCCKIIENKIIP